MNKTVVYLNLTNGLEALPVFEKYKVVRIQSTACEQKRWDYVLSDLDNGLLFDLATGKICLIVDYTQRKSVPRSLAQGIEWIKFVLYKVWFKYDYKPMVWENNVSRYFNEMYKTITPSTIKKLKYFRKFLQTDGVNLIMVSGRTENDGDYDFYNKLVQVYA